MIPAFTDQVGIDLEVVAAALRRVTVVVQSGGSRGRSARAGQGSGIIWSADGTIITNAHVATSDTVRVTLADGRTLVAQLVTRDAKRDLALLRVDPLPGELLLPTPAIGMPSALRSGELVVALGHPLGVEHSLTMGVVHAPPQGRRSPYVVADIRLAPGNSGGPLADAQGRIVGVNSMIVGGLGVAISTDVVTRLVARAAPRPTIGVEVRPVRVRSTTGGREESVALLVLSADQHAAAARAGVHQGDLLLGHAGRPFASPNELSELIESAGSGGTLRLDIGRAGKRMSCEVHLPVVPGQSRRAA